MGHRLGNNLGCSLLLFTVISLVESSRPCCCRPSLPPPFLFRCALQGLAALGEGHADMAAGHCTAASHLPCPGQSSQPITCRTDLVVLFCPNCPTQCIILRFALLSHQAYTVFVFLKKNVCGHVIKACLIMSSPKELNLGCICNLMSGTFCLLSD